jgi:hypothetical protein
LSVHSDYNSDDFVEELNRLFDTNPAAIAEIVERMIDSSPPTYDPDYNLKSLIRKLASSGFRPQAIRCVEKVRRHIPGMLELYKELISASQPR